MRKRQQKIDRVQEMYADYLNYIARGLEHDEAIAALSYLHPIMLSQLKKFITERQRLVRHIN